MPRGSFPTAIVAMTVLVARSITDTVLGLWFVMYMAQPPGETDRLLVLERAGIVHVIENETLLTPPLLDLSKVVSNSADGSQQQR